METSIKLSVLLSINTENNMKNNFTMPDVVLDLTDENKDILKLLQNVKLNAKICCILRGIRESLNL